MDLNRDYTAIAMDVKLAQGAIAQPWTGSLQTCRIRGLLYVPEHTP